MNKAAILRILWFILGLPLAIYGILCLVIFFTQRSMLYFPSRISEERAMARGKVEGLEPWRDEKGQLIGWKTPASDMNASDINGPHLIVPRLLILHGNAGMALDREPLTKLFPAWEAHILEYPGYGARAGEPSERSLVEAALQAIELLKTERPGPVYILGESIGTGVACQAAAQRPRQAEGLILLTPLNRMKAVAHTHYPWIPTFLLRDRYDSVEALTRYQGPVAFLLAEQDEVIPAHLGKNLFETYTGPKRLWIQAGARHNTLDFSPERPIWKEIQAFVETAPRL